MKRVLTLSLLLILVLTMGVAAADFPSRTITIVNPWSPGGGCDVMARMIAPYLEKYLDVSVIVINKPGSGGEIGFTYVQNSKPDGYTIGITASTEFYVFPLMREVKYNWREFRPLINIVTDPGVIAVRADDDRFPDLETFIAYAKEHPETITIGNAGIGGDDYIAVKLLEDQAGVTFRSIAFGGAGPNTVSLLGGHTDAAGLNAGEVVQYVESNQLRVLGLMAEERFPNLPDVPTFRELGYDIISSSNRGCCAPPGTPDEVVEILAEAFRKAVADPEYLERAKKAQLPLDIRINQNH